MKTLKTAEVSGKDANDPEVGWYYTAINNAEGSWSDFYHNNADVAVMSYSMPIIINNTTLGVIGIDLSVKELIEQVDADNLSDTIENLESLVNRFTL